MFKFKNNCCTPDHFKKLLDDYETIYSELTLINYIYLKKKNNGLLDDQADADYQTQQKEADKKLGELVREIMNNYSDLCNTAKEDTITPDEFIDKLEKLGQYSADKKIISYDADQDRLDHHDAVNDIKLCGMGIFFIKRELIENYKTVYYSRYSKIKKRWCELKGVDKLAIGVLSAYIVFLMILIGRSVYMLFTGGM